MRIPSTAPPDDARALGDDALAPIVTALRHCTACGDLPLGPRPIFQLSPTARLLITSQAPGTKAHASGIPFDDPSGERLREWLGLDRAVFYDARRIAILPTGLCYPGRLPKGGDASPRPACAPLWHPRVLPLLPRVRLRLLVGGHAVRLVLGPRVALEPAVRGFAAHLPQHFPLPHPSWRTRAWAARRPWFEAEVLPALRQAVAEALAP